ncbi:TlpA family protein disulfide reductase [Actinoplanes sp. NPDC049599]|uniref:TlpA family protein disulfide reductase n=1 Tax=Actinoplanes sp. NPDC049599 TaxID=3363903 RepID=UPI0037BE1A88
MSRVRGGPVPARWLTPPLALLLAACTATDTPPPTPAEDAASPFLTCAALTAAPGADESAPAPSGPGQASPAPSGAGGAASVASGLSRTASAASGSVRAAPVASGSVPAVPGGRAADLPDLSLPCFTGGDAVRLAELRGPAVINLWGSWCAPCRDELPVIQALADVTAGRLHVVGVDTRDSRDAGASFAVDRRVSIPTLFDPDTKLLTALGKVNLPVTVFVGGDGERFVYTGKALDKPTLGGLVRAHTGVTVTG